MNKQGKDKIEYLGYTWNPLSGCQHPCKDKYCYAAKIARRFGSPVDPKGVSALHELDKPVYKTTRAGDMMKDPYPYSFEPTFHRYRLDEPAKVKRPSIIGVVYMGDLFGQWVPDGWIKDVFKACDAAPQHTYVFLTKNPQRYADFSQSSSDYHSNMWFGATVTDNDSFIYYGADLFRNTRMGLPKEKRPNRFLSIEPLQGEIYKHHLRACIHYLDWVILGVQTGPGSVPPKPEWVQDIINQCRASGVPVFLKSNLHWPEKIQEWPEGMRRGEAK